ncbi:MAG: cation acetate symporter, partial [Alphaproteobacteria bacterium]
TLFYLIATRYYGMPTWFGINNISAGIFGIPAGFIVTYVVSMMTPAPSQAMQDFVRELRIPRGRAMMEESGQTA